MQRTGTCGFEQVLSLCPSSLSVSLPVVVVESGSHELIQSAIRSLQSTADLSFVPVCTFVSVYVYVYVYVCVCVRVCVSDGCACSGGDGTSLGRSASVMSGPLQQEAQRMLKKIADMERDVESLKALLRGY